ncbi:single-stranded-DNA-specific exonuclease RecJ [Puniceicoccaceae bacterium K14]|nr:single-stranded-DNA-specific exonuclease RecJ [Puniceicoccaceae bacterium K14]
MASSKQAKQLRSACDLRKWQYIEPSDDDVRKYSKSLKIGSTVAELLARLDFGSLEEANRFLHPKLGEIANPFEIPNLETAAKRISQAIDDGQKIVICGDYDVDGTTSTALLVAIIREFENYPHFIVPLRLEEGYGLSIKSADRAMEHTGGSDLFIALDCGTNSIEEAKHIIDRGSDLIIIDHHQAKSEMTEDVILVNPHVSNSGHTGTMDLCTVGLVFKLAHALLKVRRELDDKRAFKIKLRDYLDFVAMGTVTDLVPLRGENRTFARIGLQVLAKTKRQGLKSLMKVSGVEAAKGVQPVDISFRIGPRINASGRLADAALAVELMLSKDKQYAMETSLQLDCFNRERQDIERVMTEEAIELIEKNQRDQAGLLVFGEEWHPGVVGIVASRVSKSYNRPSIVLGREGNLAKGSGRSVNGINLVSALSGFADELESWGGHPMAVGISLSVDKVKAFEDYFDKAIRKLMDADAEEIPLEISTWVKLDDIDSKLMSEISLLEPFGMNNPEPIYASKGIVLKKKLQVFKDLHFRFSLRSKNGKNLQGVAWKMANNQPPLNTAIDIAYRICWNVYAGRKTIQLELVDWRLSR